MFALWDADGNEIRDEYPQMDPHDILRDPENAEFNLDMIVGKLKEIGGSDIVALHQLSQNHNFVFDASMKDGRHYIVRIARVTLPSSCDFLKDKLRRECELMRWISSVTNIPMPQVHYYDASIDTPYMVTDKCEGSLLIDAFGILPFEAKISNIRSYARIALDLFRIDAPKGIGSVSYFKSPADIQSGEPILGPYILPSGLHTPSTVFQSIDEYLKWLITVKKASAGMGTAKSELDEARVTLERLENLISESVSGYDDAAFLRSVPSHQDFSEQNVFINGEGLITGVIDWEFHMVKPAVLAAAYPAWIRYDGTADPRFINKKGQFTSFWMVSPADAERLRLEYDAIVKEEDPEYYRALKAGQFCRMAEEWLLSDGVDIGCRRMKAWLDSLHE